MGMCGQRSFSKFLEAAGMGAALGLPTLCLPLSLSLSLSLILSLEVTILLTGFLSHQTAPPSGVLAPSWWPLHLNHNAGPATQHPNFSLRPCIPRVRVCLCVLSCFTHVGLFGTLWTVVCQAPLSMGFSRQEYWRGWPCPPPRIFPIRSRIRVSCIAGRFFTLRATSAS